MLKEQRRRKKEAKDLFVWQNHKWTTCRRKWKKCAIANRNPNENERNGKIERGREKMKEKKINATFVRIPFILYY